MTIATSAGWEFDVNNVYTGTGEDILVDIIDVFIAAGWTMLERDDGVSIKTTGLNTATEWAGSGRWCRLQDPTGAGGREVVFQRGTNDRQCRAFMTKAGDDFSSGSAGTRPEHVDEMLLIGTLAGGYSTNYFHSGTITQYRWHIGCSSLPKGTTGDVYGFYISKHSTPAKSANTYMVVEPVLSSADGTHGDPDTEPYVIYTSVPSGTATVSGWYKAGLSGETYVQGGISSDAGQVSTSQNPQTGGYVLRSIEFYDTTSGVEQPDKGRGEFVRAISGFNVYDTINLSGVAGPARFMVSTTAALRWPHTVAPVA